MNAGDFLGLMVVTCLCLPDRFDPAMLLKLWLDART